jgi:hypothetical protein
MVQLMSPDNALRTQAEAYFTEMKKSADAAIITLLQVGSVCLAPAA